jgi:hypothetical protein
VLRQSIIAGRRRSRKRQAPIFKKALISGAQLRK